MIYTSDKIKYKPLVTTDEQGRYSDIKANVQSLRYFLRLLFRKIDFRPGQTPILSRAIQNKSVIGLLPTGGGKSLTYQIAAMLQPGVTLVIDPLRSLMKDQYDGLLKTGVDCISYINSDITKGAEAELQAAASADGLSIYSVSDFRSYEAQDTLYNNYVARDGKEAARWLTIRKSSSWISAGNTPS